MGWDDLIKRAFEDFDRPNRFLELIKVAIETKFFEVRDKATFVPMVGMFITGRSGYLPRRAGYGDEGAIILMNLNDCRARNIPYEWNDRTFQTAHEYIRENWATLNSGDVIDVEFILGETKEKKKSERFE